MVLFVPTSTVNATFVPTPLPLALEQLSKSTNERWTCDPVLKDEVLFARLADASTERVRQTLAGLFDARWVESDGTLRLVPDPAAARARVERFEASRRARIATELAKIQADLGKLPLHFTPAEGKSYLTRRRAWGEKVEAWLQGHPDQEPPPDDGLAHMTPSWRAAASLVLALPKRSYDALGPGDRVVYADRPTPMQRTLPTATVQALGQYRREAPAYTEGQLPFRARLILARKDDGNSNGPIEVEFQSLDAQGELVESESIDLDPTPEPTTPTGEEKAIKVDPDIIAFANFFSDDQDSTAVRDATFVEWSTRLQDPVRYEPLRWGVGAVLLQCAEASGENLIGSPTDEMTTAGPNLEGGVKPNVYLAALAPFLRRQDGWLVFDPPLRRPRLSRVAARDYIRRAVLAGGLTLDGASAWVASTPSQSADWASETIGALTSLRGNTLNVDNLRLWAALGQAARKEIRTGRPIALSDLPAPARAYLQRHLYGPENSITNGEGVEVTEAFPQGMPDAVVSLDVKREPVVLAWNAALGEPAVRRLEMPTELGFRLGSSDARGKAIEPDCFQVTEFRNYFLSVAFSPSLTMDLRYFELLLPPTVPTLNALPDDLAKAMATMRAKRRSNLVGDKP